MPFIYFPSLPPELRLKIWKAALPGPRTITISRPNHNALLQGTCNNITHTTLKGLLFACKNSHEIVKKAYNLYFHNRLEYPIPFDPDLDSLNFPDDAELRPFISPHHTPSKPQSRDIQKVKRLILPHPYVFEHATKNFMSRRTACAIILTSLQYFVNVEEVFLVSSEFMNEGEVLGFICEVVGRCYWESFGGVVPGKELPKGMLDKVEFRVLDGCIAYILD